MKKLYFLISLFLISAALSAQVKVTYMVDVKNYLAAGTELGANGMRIGGDFLVTAAMNGENAMPDWSPSSEFCGMTLVKDSIWKITVTYPAASVGLTQNYKFVNNDWGTNEGLDAENTIGADGCGTDDGAGNINRQLVVPDKDVTLLYCFDHCMTCAGKSPVVTAVHYLEGGLGTLSVAPNPVSSYVRFNLNLRQSGNVIISLYNLKGEEVISAAYCNENAGNRVYNIDVESLPAGSYIYHVNAGNASVTGNVVKL
jgi:hypothetical protein